MVATTRRSPEPAGDAPATLLRFDRGERVLHWVNASLFAVLLATAAALYVNPISAAVGRRRLVETIHVWAGLALPLPLVVTLLAGRWGAAFRADIRRLNRWIADDRRWLRTLGRDPFVVKGKFNAGQKLNAAFTAGAIPVMLMTGSIMRWPGAFSLSWRTGATFVHDWMFLFLCCSIAGHVFMATRDREALGAMWRGGRVSASWARRHAPRWHSEVSGADLEGTSPPLPPGR